MKTNLYRLCAIVLALMVCLSGCGAAGSQAMDTAASVTNTSAEEPGSAYDDAYDYDMVEEDWEWEPEAPMSPVEESTWDSGGGSSNATKVDFTEKIIYTGYLYIETTEFDNALTALNDMVSQYGGFLENSNINGNTRYNDDGSTSIVNRYADYTIRIPCDQFDPFMQQSGTIGNVISTNTSASNITSQFTDFEAQLAALELEEERLLDMLEKATEIESLIALEERLSSVRYEKDSITRMLNNWQRQVDYSTINVSLQEVEIYTPISSMNRSFGEKIRDAFRDGWSGFVQGIQNLILLIISALPVLIILAVIVVAIIVIIKKAKKRRAAKYAAWQSQQENHLTQEADKS